MSSRIGARTKVLFDIAYLTLLGVGDARLGEWKELGDLAVHVRRRLTAGEMRYARIADVVDVRGTEEFAARIQRMRPFLPPQMRGVPDDALP